MAKDDLESFKIQFYAVSGVLAFLVIVLIAVVIHLFVKVTELAKGEEYYEDEEVETRSRPPPPQVSSGFSFPKPNISKNWHDDDAEVRRQNDQKEHSLPKPALSKSWQAYPGEKDRNQPKRNQGNDFRYDDDMSNYSYDGNGKNPGGAFRNPLSGNNDSERKYDYNDNRSDRQSRPPGPPGFKLPSISGSNFNQGGHDNSGYRRDVQRNNNYY